MLFGNCYSPSTELTAAENTSKSTGAAQSEIPGKEFQSRAEQVKVMVPEHKRSKSRG